MATENATFEILPITIIDPIITHGLIDFINTQIIFITTMNSPINRIAEKIIMYDGDIDKILLLHENSPTCDCSKMSKTKY